MSKVRNATDGPRDVPLLDRVVQPGEVVEVPDFQPAHTDEHPLPIVWPAPTWEPVTDSPLARAAAAAAAASSEDGA